MLVALLVGLLLLALPAPAAADGRYVGLGDSVAAPSDSYVARFGAWLQANENLTDVRNVAAGGETSGTILGAQLASALALIGDGTDTRVVSVDIGGNDYLQGLCGGTQHNWNLPRCPFADNLATLLSGLRAALDADPGDERLLLMGYYNPMSGTGGEREAFVDVGLRGADMRIDGARFGDAWGMTDVSGWVACRFGGTLVDAWAAFKAGGQSLMADSSHPNAAGQAVLADLFADPSSGGPTPSCPPTSPFATTSPDAADGLMHGVVEPRLEAARWWFEFGETAAYGRVTPVAELPASAGAREVAAALPSQPVPGTYHARLVTENDHGRFAGADQVVTVPLPPAAFALATGRQRIRSVRRKGLRLNVDCPATCTTSARLHISRGTARRIGLVRRARRVTIATGSAERTGAGISRLTMRLTDNARKRVRGVKRLQGVLVLEVRTDGRTETLKAVLVLTPRAARLLDHRRTVAGATQR